MIVPTHQVAACFIKMWLDLPKVVLYAHSFKSHFSMPFDRYNNRLTLQAYTIAKGLTVYFYWGLIHGPVWCPLVLGWSVNGSNFPGQADSQQGITTGLAGETGHWSSYILWYMEPKTAWIDVIWPYKFSWIGRSRHFVAHHHPPTFTPIGMLVVSTTLWNKLSKMAGVSTSYCIH